MKDRHVVRGQLLPSKLVCFKQNCKCRFSEVDYLGCVFYRSVVSEPNDSGTFSGNAFINCLTISCKYFDKSLYVKLLKDDALNIPGFFNLFKSKISRGRYAIYDKQQFIAVYEAVMSPQPGTLTATKINNSPLSKKRLPTEYADLYEDVIDHLLSVCDFSKDPELAPFVNAHLLRHTSATGWLLTAFSNPTYPFKYIERAYETVSELPKSALLDPITEDTYFIVTDAYNSRKKS